MTSADKKKTVFEADVVIGLCGAIYTLCGKSDVEFDEVGLFNLGMQVGECRRHAFSERHLKKIEDYTSRAIKLVLAARQKADDLMFFLAPEQQSTIANRANKMVQQAAAKLGDLTEASNARKIAMEACKLATDNDLDIVRVRKLVTLATSGDSEECVTAAAMACKMMVDRGLMLGPKRVTE